MYRWHYESTLSCKEIDNSFVYVMLSNELLVKKFSKVLMDLDCLSARSRLTFCVFCKYYYFSLRKYWPTSGQSIKIRQKFWKFLNYKSIKKVYIHMKNITRLLNFLNNNYSNFLSDLIKQSVNLFSRDSLISRCFN